MRLGSICCFASPPDKYPFEFTARSAAYLAEFVLSTAGSPCPTMTSLESASRCKRSATSSRMALQVLSTREGRFLSMLNWQEFSWLACGGGGGTSTVTEVLVFAESPRSSVTVELMVMGPALAPAVSRAAFAPFGVRRPPVAVWL